MAGYKPWDIERLYDYDVDISSSILEAYHDNNTSKLFNESFMTYKLAFHIRDTKSFKLDDFTGLLGSDFVDNIQKVSAQNTRAYIDELKANGQDY